MCSSVFMESFLKVFLAFFPQSFSIKISHVTGNLDMESIAEK